LVEKRNMGISAVLLIDGAEEISARDGGVSALVVSKTGLDCDLGLKQTGLNHNFFSSTTLLAVVATCF